MAVPRRRASSTTLRRQHAAAESRWAAVSALRAGHSLRVSNRTDIDVGTVHSALAQRLVRLGYAAWGPHPSLLADFTIIVPVGGST